MFAGSAIRSHCTVYTCNYWIWKKKKWKIIEVVVAVVMCTLRYEIYIQQITEFIVSTLGILRERNLWWCLAILSESNAGDNFEQHGWGDNCVWARNGAWSSKMKTPAVYLKHIDLGFVFKSSLNQRMCWWLISFSIYCNNLDACLFSEWNELCV